MTDPKNKQVRDSGKKGPKMPSVMMTVDEVAERWGVSPKAIYGMIERRELVALRVGRVLRISRSHVESKEQGAHASKATG